MRPNCPFWASIGAAGVLALLCAASASAQTNDDAFRHWQWREPSVGARTAGLADAFVPLANDDSAVLVNPAGLAILPALGELQLTPAVVTRTDLPEGGDEWYSTIVPFAALTFHKSRADVFGFHYASQNAQSGPAASRLLTKTVAAGASWGHRLGTVAVGVSLGVNWFHLDSYSTTSRPDGTAEVVELRDRGRGRATVTAGMLWQPGTEWRFGASFRYRPGSWHFQRTAYDAATLELAEPPTSERLYPPSVASGGVAWQRVTSRSMFRGLSKIAAVAQGDVLVPIGAGGQVSARYGFPAGDYAVSTGWGVRAALEMTWPVAKGTRSIQARVGGDVAGPVVVEYQGPDAAERARFPAPLHRTGFGAGLSFGGNTGLRGHVAVRKAADDLTLLVSFAIRYPGLFP